MNTPVLPFQSLIAFENTSIKTFTVNLTAFKELMTFQTLHLLGTPTPIISLKMAFLQRRNSCPVTKASIYSEPTTTGTRASVDGRDIIFSSYRECRTRNSSLNTSNSQSSELTIVEDRFGEIWFVERNHASSFFDEEATMIMGKLNNVIEIQRRQKQLKIWNLLKSKLRNTTRLQEYGLKLFRSTAFRSKGNKELENYKTIETDEEYLELSPPLCRSLSEDLTEIDYLRRTQREAFEALLSTCHAKPTLKRSGAFKWKPDLDMHFRDDEHRTIWGKDEHL
jgi:hypothetical protein